MRFKNLYQNGYLNNINQILGVNAIDTNQVIDGPIPIESIIKNLGYTIQTTNQITATMAIKDQTVYLNANIPNAKQRFYLAKFLGELIYDANHKQP